MKLAFVQDYDRKRKAGYKVEIDKVEFSRGYAGNCGVRVINEWAEPKWLTIIWFDIGEVATDLIRLITEEE